MNAAPLRVIGGVTVVLALMFAGITASDYLFGSDSARYVELARSLAHGEGYLQFGQTERHFPPGFPLVLAPATLLGNSFATMARWAAIVGALAFRPSTRSPEPGPLRSRSRCSPFSRWGSWTSSSGIRDPSRSTWWARSA